MSMVLGHTFTFSDPEDAEQLVKFFRKEGISARIEPVSETSISIFIKGTYDNLFAYLDYLKNDLQKEADNQSEEDISYDDENTDLEEVQEIIKLIQMQREYAIEGLTGKNIGDIAYKAPESEEDTSELFSSMVAFMMKNRVLIDNHVVEYQDGALVYKEIKPVEELLFSYAVSSGLIPEEEDLKTYNISIIHKILAEVDYKVKTGPELIARVDFDRLKEELECYDVSEDFILHAINSIIIKQEMVEHIMNILHVTKAGTIEELLEEVDKASTEIQKEQQIYISYKISPEFTNQVIEDLKKMEVIRIKGNKIKLTR